MAFAMFVFLFQWDEQSSWHEVGAVQVVQCCDTQTPSTQAPRDDNAS